MKYMFAGLLIYAGIVTVAASFNNNLAGTWAALTNTMGGAKPTSSLKLPPQLTPGNPQATNG